MKKLSLILALILIAASIGCVQTGIAFAASETVYTGVLEDLQKDKSFDVNSYPSKDSLSDEDKIMDVIQIAESNAGELFLYVYQPQAGKYTASEVRISQTVGDNLEPKDYKLTLLSREGTLEKYKVEELQLKSDAVRYYLVVQLARPWENGDEQTYNNTSSSVPYEIGKLFTACTTQEGVSYSEQHAETIRITSKYCGFIRNFTGWQIVASTNFDSHFVAFSTDRSMEKLMQASLTYESYTYTDTVNRLLNTRVERSRTETTKKTVTATADSEHTIPAYWLGSELSWKEIESKEQFISREEVPENVRKNMSDKDWVLRFATLPFTEIEINLEAYQEVGVRVSNATILALTFETDGVVYKLGVIDNKQTGSDEPVNNPLDGWNAFLKEAEDFFKSLHTKFQKFAEWLKTNWWVIVVGVLALLLAISLFIKVTRDGILLILKWIGKLLWWFVKYLAIGLFYIVTLPVWLIVWGVRAIKNNKNK